MKTKKRLQYCISPMKLTKFIALATAVIEFVGAVLLSFSFVPKFGVDSIFDYVVEPPFGRVGRFSRYRIQRMCLRKRKALWSWERRGILRRLSDEIRTAISD